MSTHNLESHATGTSATDPVCSAMVDPETAKRRFAFEGREYFFCSKGCRKKFKANPEGYLSGEVHRAEAEAAAEAAANATREHVCPMNPKVHQIGPGMCPKCGTPFRVAKSGSEPS